MSDDSQERCQCISDLLKADHSFPRLSSVEFLTNVGLILARVAMKLVDAPLEMGMMLRSAVSASFLRSLFKLTFLCFFADMTNFQK